MKITKKYAFAVPIVLLQVITVLGMDQNPKDHYNAIAQAWQGRKKLSDEETEKHYAQILKNQEVFQSRFKGGESPIFPNFPRKPNFPELYYRHTHPDKVETAPREFKKTIVEYAQQTIPVFSQKALHHAHRFLESKKTNGSDIEKALYKTMTIPEFFVRLYTKRPLVSYNSSYHGYKVILLTKDGIYAPFTTKRDPQLINKLKDIGTPQEQSPFELGNILSLQEAEIGALCGISSPTHFINDGHRQNQGLKNNTPFEKSGVQIGLVGVNHEIADFFGCKHLIKKENKIESDIEITNNNVNSSLRDYGKIIGLYYRPSIGKEHMKDILCNALYEANTRGKHVGKSVFLHVVGVGLGAWQLFKTEKEDIEIVNFLGVVKELLEDSKHTFKNISNIDFSWIDVGTETLNKIQLENNQKISNIKISFSKRNPTEKLIDENEDKYIVAIYPWDSYAHVGNEYWDGMYSASGDPAAACCSLIPTFQQPEINHFLIENILTAVQNGLSILNLELTPEKDLTEKKAVEAERMTELIALEQSAQEAATEKAQTEKLEQNTEKKLPSKTFMQKVLSSRVAQFTGALGIVATLCYYLTTSQQKDTLTSAITHYWEKLYNFSPSSVRSTSI